MKDRLEIFIAHVREVSENEGFIHHDWFVEYHLEIVEKIALDLCGIYVEADKDKVRLLCWLHDYGKILDFDNQYTKTLSAGREKLVEIGFDEKFVDEVIGDIAVIDRKDRNELERASIEVKIVSSSDAASHLVGPFFQMWWYENPGRDYRQLMQDNIKKAMIDWDRKVVIPEIKKAFKARHDMILEQSGVIPSKFF